MQIELKKPLYTYFNVYGLKEKSHSKEYLGFWNTTERGVYFMYSAFFDFLWITGSIFLHLTHIKMLLNNIFLF